MTPLGNRTRVTRTITAITGHGQFTIFFVGCSFFLRPFRANKAFAMYGTPKSVCYFFLPALDLSTRTKGLSKDLWVKHARQSCHGYGFGRSGSNAAEDDGIHGGNGRKHDRRASSRAAQHGGSVEPLGSREGAATCRPTGEFFPGTRLPHWLVIQRIC